MNKSVLYLSLICLICLLMLSLNSCNKPLTGTQLLDNAIAYHDPNGEWETFNGSFTVRMETPSQAPRNSSISINLQDEIFDLVATRDSITTRFTLNKGDCDLALNNSSDYTEELAATYNLNCERAEMYKNYYTYLYGLPMKLKDNGTQIHDTVETKSFKGKDYLVLKVTYDKSVGSDVWYFYFNPDNYAMETYQFFKTDENGRQKDDTGEYILLTEDAVINTIKMPKNRAWYYNKDDKYLGTDILNP